MKKVTVLLILSLAICLAACGKKVSTPDEMLDVVKEKENISAEVDMIECGRIVDNDTTIVVGMTGENDKTYHYYAAQFSKNQDGKYKYKNAISLNDIGWQLRLGKLNTGYIIVCNNENVSTIQAVISPRNGADITKNIEINNIPFVYYLDMSNIPSDYDIQYKFLNENGEEIQYIQEDEIKLLHRKDGSYQQIYGDKSVEIPDFLAKEMMEQGVLVIEEVD